MPNDAFQPVFQVSEFNEVVNNHLNLLGEVTIEGELTRMDIKNGRLIFASIKDKSSSLDIFSMAHLIRNFRQFEPGMLVRVTGTAGLYKTSSRFRLMATSMVPQGEGALQIAFEKLKAQLEAEGLFAPERKRPLPPWPHRIGLITAKDSSAYFDLVKIISARMGGLTLKLLPVNVQGREAVSTILRALAYTNRHPETFDVLILARGGGSLEDLAAFNDESVARAVFSSQVPLISAIGHEDNWSLTDYVADIRASTPSNAAEIVVRDRREVVAEVAGSVTFIRQLLLRQVNRDRLAVTESVGIIRHTALRISRNVNQVVERVNRAGRRYRLELRDRQARVALLAATSRQSIRHRLQLTRQELASLTRLVQSLDYQEILNRGFSITKNSRGRIITQSSVVSPGERLTTQLASGIIKSIAD